MRINTITWAQITALAVLLSVVAARTANADSTAGFAGQSLFVRNMNGVLFSEKSCAACHQSNGVSYQDEVARGTVVRLGNSIGTGDPIYGAQLQPWSGLPQSVKPEAEPAIEWDSSDKLRIAKVTLSGLNYGPMSQSTRVALRRPPALAGVALLAEIPDAEIVKQEAQEKPNKDGVRGRAAWLPDKKLGRFGWKATQPTLAAQTAAALSRDMGLSTTNFPEPWGDCTAAETSCRNARLQRGAFGHVAIQDSERDQIVAYLTSIPVPQSSISPVGNAVFRNIGCSSCHATLHLKDGTPVEAYTDLLLHRMGNGLDDGIKDGSADSGEWRTAPLWNVRSTLNSSGLLHDGRARSVPEAIEWHDGEAKMSRQRFEALPETDREAVVRFVSNL